MANPEHLEILIEGVAVWNRWIEESFGVSPDLSGANLRGYKLNHINFSSSNLTGANFSQSELLGANFSGAALDGANLCGTPLQLASFVWSRLDDTNFDHSVMGGTVFSFNDLSRTIGLDSVRHNGPSSVSIDTLYKSRGNIPESFLRGCGVPEEFIAFARSLVEAAQPIQFYSCFISYSHKDEEFANRLYSRMRDAKLRVWSAPEEMKGGQKLHEQLFSAIQIHDKLLLVLSENSLKSEWVATEIRRARKREREEKRRVLFPIRLVDFEVIQKWECFDADSGKDLAVELREYFIPDFSNWKDHDSFEKAFDRLLRDLKAGE